MKVIEGQFGKRAPNDLSKVLRGIADDVDAGKVTSLVAAYIVDGEYEFTFSASLQDELVLATLLKDSVINHFKI